MSAGKRAPQSGEDQLIARYFRPLATHPGAFGLIDDAAAVTPPAGHDLVLKTDPVICGVHFFADDPPDAVARKALRVNLSDLAAKGARPLGFLLALALPGDIDAAWLEAFAAGLGDDAERYGCALLGGDTDRTPGPLTVSITALGTLPHGSIVRRRGAAAGDHVVVTGTIGDAALGLLTRRDANAAERWGLADAVRTHLAMRYLLPQPRTELAEAVRRHASAAMDISDGLVGDLGKLCRASAISATVDADQVPLSPAAALALRADAALREAILTGGDDYELLCTVRPPELAGFQGAAAAAEIPLTVIGEIKPGDGAAEFRDAQGRALTFARSSYSHF